MSERAGPPSRPDRILRRARPALGGTHSLSGQARAHPSLGGTPPPRNTRPPTLLGGTRQAHERAPARLSAGPKQQAAWEHAPPVSRRDES
jgi:hypothetical protein